MDRRKAVQAITLLMGGTLSTSTLSILLEGCNQELKSGNGTTFTGDEHSMISRMADIIIPRTDTPGALDAGVPAFIVLMMQQCYPPKDQQAFHTGLAAFDHQCKEKYGASFLNLSTERQGQAVKYLDGELLGQNSEARHGKEKLNFYHHMKALTLLGFFTSEPGATQTLRYIQIPGRYDGCIPYHKGDKAWAA